MADNRVLKTILIVDDNEQNRELLKDFLEDDYKIVEVSNGIEAVALIKKMGTEISLVMLDYVMPEMDGFGVLDIMNKSGEIHDIPVIMITAEQDQDVLAKAYGLGVTDFIQRPFNMNVVMHRVENTINLYTKQRRLSDFAAQQITDKTKNNTMLVTVLSHIVEFRNGESGMHVLHINTITEMLLRALLKKKENYGIRQEDIMTICTASSLHDIGKISIPDEVLNKPGRLTTDEFAIMKTHSRIGADMLENVPFSQDEPLIKYAYQICRWHHERWDGKGYPDGLKGNAIPIAAQIVSMADVYDALTNERVYKPAYPHERAMEMIKGGECGDFNPVLLECLDDIGDELQRKLGELTPEKQMDHLFAEITSEMLDNTDLAVTAHAIQSAFHSKKQQDFLFETMDTTMFEVFTNPPMLTMTEYAARSFGVDEIIMNPLKNEQFINMIGQEELEKIVNAIRVTTPDSSRFRYDVTLHTDRGDIVCDMISNIVWSSEENPRIVGIYGKFNVIEDKRDKEEKVYAGVGAEYEPMDVEEGSHYTFNWDKLGDVRDGRGNLGLEMPIAIHRVMQYSMLDAMSDKYGTDESDEMFRKAGYLAGYEVAANLMNLDVELSQFLTEVKNLFKNYKLGVFRPEYIAEDLGEIVVTIAQGCGGSGIVKSNETVCTYEEGFLMGILKAYTGNEYDVREIDCWAMGDRVCRFMGVLKKGGDN